MKTKQLHLRRVGLRWGRLLAAIEAARHAVSSAYADRDLLSAQASKELTGIHHRLASVQQAAWHEEEEEAAR